MLATSLLLLPAAAAAKLKAVTPAPPPPGLLDTLTPAQLAILATAGALMAGLSLWLVAIRARGGGSAGPAPRVGVVGLGVMGSQLLLNLSESLGEPVAGLDTDAAKAAAVEAAAKGEGLQATGHTTAASFVRSMARPRTILLLVPAGPAVDAVVSKLLPYLKKDDVVIDCGNEWFAETERRQAALTKKGIRFMGCGTSGGEKGARLGPCLMPSGDRKAWEIARPLLEAIAAHVVEKGDGNGGNGNGGSGGNGGNGGGAKAAGGGAGKKGRVGTPCVGYIGPGGSGHYVKMVRVASPLLYSMFSKYTGGEGKEEGAGRDTMSKW
jgi:6-phosphogluconate dehydrogenase (decarboxylating)